jgi:hypothetical protein
MLRVLRPSETIRGWITVDRSNTSMLNEAANTGKYELRVFRQNFRKKIPAVTEVLSAPDMRRNETLDAGHHKFPSQA